MAEMNLNDILRLVSDDGNAAKQETRSGVSPTFWARFCKRAQEDGKVRPTCVIDFAYTDSGNLRGNQRLLERLYAYSDMTLGDDEDTKYRVVLHVHTLIPWQRAMSMGVHERLKSITAVNLRIMEKPVHQDWFETTSEILYLLPRSERLRSQWRELYRKGQGQLISWSWQDVPNTIPEDRRLQSEYLKVAGIISLGEGLLESDPDALLCSHSVSHTALVRGGVEEEYVVVAMRKPVDAENEQIAASAWQHSLSLASGEPSTSSDRLPQESFVSEYGKESPAPAPAAFT
eukprot:3937066-Rhodomonas_salina.1